jgi:DNA-binding transcriptional regulator LsrR (DeoR family)
VSAAELKPSELVQIAAVARRYYIDGKAKTEIASEFGISRFRVARILERARDSGLVHVDIVLPAPIDADLSERLRTAFSLHHAIAVSTPDEPEESLRSRLGEVGASLLSELVREDDILGIGWGRTISVMTAEVTTMARCTMVQLTGAAGTVEANHDSVETLQRIAAVSGGPYYPIYAPLVADTVEAADTIRRQPHVARALRLFDSLTKAVVAVGSWDPPNSQLYDATDHVSREALRRLGARAEVCLTLFDANGHRIEADVTERFIGISTGQLCRIPEVIAIAGGRTKLAAIRAVLAAGFVTSIVTDAATARALLTPSEERLA